jgi:NTP pyrophosphatase (non-canonical NTP hydrolase)
MTTPDLTQLAATMRANSERWFPGLHHDPLLPLAVFYALGLGGEAGEVLDEIKKAFRTNGDLTQRDNLAAELADVLTYPLLLADELDIDLVAAYETKAAYNEARWGQPTPPTEHPAPRATRAGLVHQTCPAHRVAEPCPTCRAYIAGGL